MNKYERQAEIRRRELVDTVAADQWAKSNGISAEQLASADPTLVLALQKANELLTQHRSLLTAGQVIALESFKRKMASKRISSKLKPDAAISVFNVSTKINRQLFRQYRQLTKSQKAR